MIIIYTSYFAQLKHIPSPVAICRYPPNWYKGKVLTALAPSDNLLKLYKGGAIDQKEFTDRYKREVLKPLDAHEYYNYIIGVMGDDATLVCFEKPCDFCHRRIVAAWFKHYTGHEVPELNFTVKDDVR